MEVGDTREPKPAQEVFTAQELLQELSGDDWADTATPPLTSSPRKNLEVPWKSMFLGTLDEKAGREFLSEFNQETESETTLDDFKEELWNTVVKFGEPVLMGTGLDGKTRNELLSKMVKLRGTRQKTGDDECKDSSTLKQKTDDKMIKVKGEDKLKTNNLIKDINILNAQEGGGKSREGWTGTKRSNQ